MSFLKNCIRNKQLYQKSWSKPSLIELVLHIYSIYSIYIFFVCVFQPTMKLCGHVGNDSTQKVVHFPQRPCALFRSAARRLFFSLHLRSRAPSSPVVSVLWLTSVFVNGGHLSPATHSSCCWGGPSAASTDGVKKNHTKLLFYIKKKGPLLMRKSACCAAQLAALVRKKPIKPRNRR